MIFYTTRMQYSRIINVLKNTDYITLIKKISATIFGLVLTIFFCAILFNLFQKPSNDRDWDPLFEKLSQVSFTGTQFTISNVRDWRYENDQIVSQESISYSNDIKKLKQTYFLLEPLGGWNGLAHTFISFEFEDGSNLNFSVEARREKHEQYDFISGVLNQYEIMYMWGTDYDFIARRPVYLNNTLYMYPLEISLEIQQQFLYTVLQETQQLNSKPRFYNTLTSNCTNTLFNEVNSFRPQTIPSLLPARLLTGYADNFLYSHSYIPTDQPFDEIEKRFNITELTKENYQSPDFSKTIRSL